MDEEEYLSLQPILPTYKRIGGPILSDNAITVRRENIPGADTPRGFGRGQSAARLLREGRLRANMLTVNRNAPNGQYTSSGNFPKYFEIFGQHGNDDRFIRINEHTPLADTYDVSRIAAFDPTNLEMLPAEYFPPSDAGGSRNNEHSHVINDVGYFRPELDPNKAIPDINMPWDDKANVYAHQLVRGLSDTLRQFGVTDEELRRIA